MRPMGRTNTMILTRQYIFLLHAPTRGADFHSTTAHGLAETERTERTAQLISHTVQMQVPGIGHTGGIMPYVARTSYDTYSK